MSFVDGCRAQSKYLGDTGRVHIPLESGIGEGAVARRRRGDVHFAAWRRATHTSDWIRRASNITDGEDFLNTVMWCESKWIRGMSANKYILGRLGSRDVSEQPWAGSTAVACNNILKVELGRVIGEPAIVRLRRWVAGLCRHNAFSVEARYRRVDSSERRVECRTSRIDPGNRRVIARTRRVPAL
ncbi:hypothetical protein C8R46DRAFT_1035038 [Mycena filopes]|nr:hypothetical protein C8R46DRAFT_1035038 [Mycena filopes]